MSNSDPTFRQYTSKQAATYKQARGAYPAKLYEVIFAYHKGERDTVLDVGCGPGNATTALASYFSRAIGVDPGTEMIETAKQAGGQTAAGQPIDYLLCAAEDLDTLKQVKPESVDMLTAATCAHWFDMNKFWLAAARLVKPGGTVAMWSRSSVYCHPAEPYAAAVQAKLDQLELETLAPYMLPANIVCREMYGDLPMPWNVEPLVEAFPRSLFVRNEYDRNGKLSDGKDFFGASGQSLNLGQLESGISTASAVTRWREAHRDLAKGPEDVVTRAFDEIAEIVAPGSNKSRETLIRAGVSGVLLLFRKQEHQ